ncbi:MAG: MFS transporter [Candidatus Hodarchaeota archaeon]
MLIKRFKLTKIRLKDLTPIILVMLLLFISIACANMLIPSYPAIRFEFMIPESLIAIPDAFFLLISACCALIWGYFTDRIDRTKVIIAAAFSWTIGMMLTAFSINYLMLVISRMFSGMGLGSVLPVGYSIISDAIPPDERSGWFGTLAILSSISNAIGQALSSFLGPILTWRFPFFLLSVISIAIAFSLFFVKIPRRGVSEEELLDLIEMNLEYSYRISKKDLLEIGKIKTNLYLIIQGFFMIIPGTILVYFTTSMLSLHFFNELPDEIRLQTATIFAGLMGIGYILGNMIISYISDILFRKNKKNRTRLATFCMITAIPFSIAMLLFLRPINVSSLNIIYPEPIPTSEIATYMFLTIGEVFSVYPTYILFFLFALIGSILGAGPVANKNAVMVDINLPEHRGTAASFFNLSEQIGKGVTLLLSYLLISFFSFFSFPSESSIYNMMFFSMFFWIPASILWYRASKTVEDDMIRKSMLLSERKQISLLDYVFELEIQMDRGIQKVQDSKYYILTDPNKFNNLLDDAIKIFTYCEREGEVRSITNIENMCNTLNIKAKSIKKAVNQIYSILNSEDLSEKEKDLYITDLKQILLKIAEGEKSTFGELQIYYDDAYLKIVEARLLRKNELIKSLAKVTEAINIYQRVKNLLSERLEIINEHSELSKEDLLVYEKEQGLYEKCKKSLVVTTRLREEYEEIFNQLEEKGIKKEDLIKISELTLEFNIDLYQVMVDTFGQEKETKKALKRILDRIERIFIEYDHYREVELKVF